jgi:hypothetical protein
MGQLLLVEAGLQSGKIFIAAAIAGFGCSQNPAIGGECIFRSAEAVHQQEAELDAGTGVALLSGFFEPASGFLVALADPLTAKIKIGQIISS